MTKGNIFVISAPSGTGKTTILKKVISQMENVAFSVSHTTRSPRPGEQEGDDYFFVDRDVFETMRKEDHFLEWAEVHGNLYGTSRQAVRTGIDQGIDVILDIDVQGGRQIREKIGREAVFVFIAPPSLTELEHRLKMRGTDPESVIAVRMQNARKELMDMDRYDYVIMNDVVENGVQILKSIIVAERSRNRRSINGASLEFATL